MALPVPHPDDPHLDLYAAAGVDPDLSSAAIDLDVRRRARRTPLDPGGDRWLAWKILRDPLYRSCWDEYRDVATVVEAGFFDDGLSPGALDRTDRHPLRWVATPTTTARTHLSHLEPDNPNSTGPVNVLLSTGGFAPFHDGHAAMLAAAADLVATRGPVVATYVSPGHDDYVASKGRDLPVTAARLATAGPAAHGIDVDPWEAIGAPTAVNYPEVQRHLQRFLTRHLGVEVRVWYVFGADNAGFLRAYVRHGHAVCLPRVGYEPRLAEVMADRRTTDHPDRVIIGPTAPGPAASSTRIRAATTAPATTPTGPDQTRSQDIVLRHHPTRSAPHLPAARISAFQAELERLLREATGRTVRPVDARAQGERAHREAADPDRIICLDALTADRFAHQLHLSRIFELDACQAAARRVAARPGHPEVAAQWAVVPPGSYTLLDDDIATGATMAGAEASCPAHVTLTGRATMTDTAGVADVVDLGDFVVGAPGGGLVVTLPDGSLGRAPYLLPYVNPVTRASVRAEAAAGFSRAVWLANAELYAPTGLTVADADPHFRALAALAGAGLSTQLSDWCAWHVEGAHVRVAGGLVANPATATRRVPVDST